MEREKETRSSEKTKESRTISASLLPLVFSTKASSTMFLYSRGTLSPIVIFPNKGRTRIETKKRRRYFFISGYLLLQ